MGRRVVVVGNTGSGKTTLARALGRRLGVPHIELDALHWEPGWMPAARDTFRQRVEQALRGETWVVDGNYGAVRDIVWRRADTLIWLDYPLRINLWRLLHRTLRRSLTRTELWNGNRERFRSGFLSRDSLFVWLLRSYRRRRREYPRLLAQPEHAHLGVTHLYSPRTTRRWLGGVRGDGKKNSN